MLHMSAAGAPWISPVLLIAFSPGSTKLQLSLSHDIHSVLRKSSANRIPIFGGSSADYFKFDRNYQLVNNRVTTDAIAVAFIETEIRFGLGMSHGFLPTTRRVLVTRASGHVVHEFDNRPAAEVYADSVWMISCALRLASGDNQEEIRLLNEKVNLPIYGFYTYGEKGLLMTAEGLTETQAYRKLQKTSMQKNKSLKEVAEAVILMLE